MNQRPLKAPTILTKCIGVNQRVSPNLVLDDQILNSTGVAADNTFYTKRIEGKRLVEFFNERILSITEVGESIIVQGYDTVFSLDRNEFLQSLQNVEQNSETLTYVSGGDTNGVFYFLGTKKGTEAWGNPAEKAQLAWSGDTDSSGVKSQLSNRANGDWKTITKEAPYVVFDLGVGHALEISTLTIKSTSIPSENPPHISLEGSNDGTNWTGLFQQSNLSWTANQWKNFTIDANDAYRYFRIIHSVDGLNYEGERMEIDFYIGDGFELYSLGTVSTLTETEFNTVNGTLSTGTITNL